MDRRNRLPVVGRQGRCLIRGVQPSSPHNERVRCPCRDDGGGEIVRFFARLDLGTAFATLIRQRHPMPSCGGLAPTAERTVDPAWMIAESLTSDPGIREQNRHKDADRHRACTGRQKNRGMTDPNKMHHRMHSSRSGPIHHQYPSEPGHDAQGPPIFQRAATWR